MNYCGINMTLQTTFRDIVPVNSQVILDGLKNDAFKLPFISARGKTGFSEGYVCMSP